MKLMEYLENNFEEFKENMSCLSSDELSIDELKMNYLVEDLLCMTTYDDAINEKFGRVFLNVLQSIYDKTTFEYISKSDKSYIEYILVVNQLIRCNMLDWGTSIRGTWLTTGRVTFPGVEEFIYVNDEKEYLDFIKWFEPKKQDGEEEC